MTSSPTSSHVWLALVWPLVGAFALAAAFDASVRPMLTLPDWLLDGATVLCGAAGLVASGMLVSTTPSWLVRPEAGWRMVPTFATTGVAVVGAVVMTGLPITSWRVLAGGVVAAVSVVILQRRLSAQ